MGLTLPILFPIRPRFRSGSGAQGIVFRFSFSILHSPLFILHLSRRSLDQGIVNVHNRPLLSRVNREWKMENGEWKMEVGRDGKVRRKGEDLEERLLGFAARVGKVVDALPGTRLGRHIAEQLVRSGTSPAPNYAEACAAESKKDFNHKLGIALKELRETPIWLRLIVKTELLPLPRLTEVIDECEQLNNIVGRSLITAKSNRARWLAFAFRFAFSILHYPLFILHLFHRSLARH
jgi:four helix bundle protein